PAAPALAGLVREEEAEAVLHSATSREAAAGLRAERATLRELPALLVLGGAAFAREPELAAEVGGVFLGNDARKAVRELGALLAKRRPAADGACGSTASPHVSCSPHRVLGWSPTAKTA